MDEPLSNLDAKLRVQMRAEIKKLHQRLRTTFVYVTNDQVEAMTMADRIVLLHEGIIQQYDVPAVIYDRPANVFVATFIGSPPMNIVKVNRSSNGLTMPSRDGQNMHNWQISLGEHFANEFEDNMFLGIRPEHILINNPGNVGPTLELPCRVDLIEPMGAETYLYLVGNGHSINARVEPSVKVEVGQQVTAHIPVSRFHLFRQTNTERIRRKAE
jgi:ABC-type sugar transport system ATPase subunit